MELLTISRSTNYICPLFLLFFSISEVTYVLILKSFCQNHAHLAEQLKAHEEDNQKLSIDQ